MQSPLDILKSTFISVYNQRSDDLKLSESEIQAKLCEKHSYSGVVHKLNDIISSKIKGLCYFNVHPEGFDKFTDEEKEEHGKKEHEARIKEQNDELFISSELNRISENLYLEANLCNKEINYAKIIKNLWAYLCGNFYYLRSEETLKTFFDYGIDLYLIDGDRFLGDSWFKHSDVLINAVNYFELKFDNDYTISSSGTKIVIKDPASISMHSEIESLIKEIGGIQTLQFIFTTLDNKYYSDFDRYLIYKIKSQTIENVPTPTPYNYLMQMAVKFLNIRSTISFEQKVATFEKLLEASTKFIELLNVYSSNIFGDMMFDWEDIPNYLHDNTILETLCIPQQYSPDFVKLIVEKLYIPTFNDECPELYKANSFIKMIAAILKYPPCSIITAKKLSEQVRSNKEYVKKFLIHF